MVKRSTTTTQQTADRPRRARCDGGVWQDEKGWMAQIDLGMVDGKRVRRRTRALSESEARAKVRKLQATADSRLPLPDSSTTTGDWLTFWLEEILPGTVRPTTEANYRPWATPASPSLPTSTPKSGPSYSARRRTRWSPCLGVRGEPPSEKDLNQ